MDHAVVMFENEYVFSRALLADAELGNAPNRDVGAAC